MCHTHIEPLTFSSFGGRPRFRGLCSWALFRGDLEPLSEEPEDTLFFPSPTLFFTFPSDRLSLRFSSPELGLLLSSLELRRFLSSAELWDDVWKFNDNNDNDCNSHCHRHFHEPCQRQELGRPSVHNHPRHQALPACGEAKRRYVPTVTEPSRDSCSGVDRSPRLYLKAQIINTPNSCDSSMSNNLVPEKLATCSELRRYYRNEPLCFSTRISQQGVFGDI